MNTSRIIAAAMQAADTAKKNGAAKIKLPVMEFSEWARFHFRSDNLASREAFRADQKRNYYFKRFLESRDIEVVMIVCPADKLIDWADENDHPLTTEQERTHVLAHYTNSPGVCSSQCVHKKPDASAFLSLGPEVFGTLSMFGETQESPEILSAVVHTRDGKVVDSKEILAIEHESDEAFNLASEFFRSCGVQKAFLDKTVRRPDFCPDCNELLVNVASELEYQHLED